MRMDMIKFISIVSVLFVLVSCSSNHESVSLLSYINQAELDKLGLTQDKIQQINNENISLTGYTRYDNYYRYKYGAFDILLNAKNPNELYVVKDGIFLTGIRDNGVVELYRDNTKFPNPYDLSVFWMPNKSNVIIANKNKMYFDVGLNGVDAVFNKIPHTNKNTYLNYVDIVKFLPQSDIDEAFIDGLQCKALVGHYACCTNDNINYFAYQFQDDTGWSKSANKKIQNYCQLKDVSKLQEQLRQNIYQN